MPQDSHICNICNAIGHVDVDCPAVTDNTNSQSFYSRPFLVKTKNMFEVLATVEKKSENQEMIQHDLSHLQKFKTSKLIVVQGKI